MKLYISGPMTGKKDLNEPAFRLAEGALKRAGYDVVVPHDNGLPKSATYIEHMRADIKMMMDCDGVATLRGFSDSNGSKIEITLAGSLAIPVGEIQYWIESEHAYQIESVKGI